MTRKWLETVTPFTKLKAKPYLSKVIRISKQRKPAGFLVTIEHYSSEQTGRRQCFILSRPCRPAGLTYEFFTACGLTLKSGLDFEPTQVVGCNLYLIPSINTDSDHLIDYDYERRLP